MLGSRSGGGNYEVQDKAPAGEGRESSSSSAPSSSGSGPSSGKPPAKKGGDFVDFEDDIPF